MGFGGRSHKRRISFADRRRRDGGRRSFSGQRRPAERLLPAETGAGHVAAMGERGRGRTAQADAQVIETSLEAAAERAGDLTPRVYELLFERQPEMRPHFWRDQNGAIKGEMLMRVFEAILDFIGERQYAHRLIQCEVLTHAGYDVPPDVFATFFGLVGEVVCEAAGPDWTAAMEAAWDRMLADLDFYVTRPDQAALA
jgi:hemoglobin-like flavoprotein